MSGAEFAAWRAFDTLSPIDGRYLVRQSALTSALIANAYREPNQEARGIDDFDLYRERQILTRDEEESRFRAAFEAAGLVRR